MEDSIHSVKQRPQLFFLGVGMFEFHSLSKSLIRVESENTKSGMSAHIRGTSSPPAFLRAPPLRQHPQHATATAAIAHYAWPPAENGLVL